MSLIVLHSKMKEFVKRLKKIEELEDAEWEYDEETEDEGEEGMSDSDGESEMDITPGKHNPLVDSIMEDMDRLLVHWKKFEEAYGKIESIVAEVKQIQKGFEKMNSRREAEKGKGKGKGKKKQSDELVDKNKTGEEGHGESMEAD
jgi:hypothetical protein